MIILHSEFWDSPPPFSFWIRDQLHFLIKWRFNFLLKTNKHAFNIIQCIENIRKRARVWLWNWSKEQLLTRPKCIVNIVLALRCCRCCRKCSLVQHPRGTENQVFCTSANFHEARAHVIDLQKDRIMDQRWLLSQYWPHRNRANGCNFIVIFKWKFAIF